MAAAAVLPVLCCQAESWRLGCCQRQQGQLLLAVLLSMQVLLLLPLLVVVQRVGLVRGAVLVGSQQWQQQQVVTLLQMERVQYPTLQVVLVLQHCVVQVRLPPVPW